jgi:predicted nucleic acid-binding protein
VIPEGKLVVDTSVVMKWYLPEVGSAEAAPLLERHHPLIAPDLLIAEFGNVIWKKVRNGELARAEAEEVVDAFISSTPVELRPASLFLRPALDLAIRWQCTVYDALYLAVALAEACPFITADTRFRQGLRGTVLEQSILLLGEQ